MEDSRALHDRIHAFIVANFLFDSEDIAGNASLIGEGIVDSTGILELIMFVEEYLGVTVTDDEVLPENFDSIDKLTAYAQRKLAALGPEEAKAS